MPFKIEKPRRIRYSRHPRNVKRFDERFKKHARNHPKKRRAKTLRDKRQAAVR